MNFERSGEIKQNTASQNPEALSKLQKHIKPLTLHGKETDLWVENNVWLAPLAGVTDLPFRLVCKNSSYSPGLVFSEMISAKGVHYKGNNSIALADSDPKEAPLSVQIFGSEPEIMAECAAVFKSRGVVAIDINMGCPMQKVTSNGEGSALLKNPNLIEKIVSGVSACGLPVTVKIRRGYEIGNELCVEAALAAESGGAAAVTVHGRFRDEYYSGNCNTEAIKKVVYALKIPVIGNGDIICAESALNMFETTGCSGIMIGRAALGKPWLFRELLTPAENPYIPSKEDIISTINAHIEHAVRFKGENHGITEMRKHLAWYTKGVKGAAAVRDRIFKARTFEEACYLINEIFK